MTEIKRELTTEGRIEGAFPTLAEKLDPAVREQELQKLAGTLRLYITTEQELPEDWQGWFMVDQHLTKTQEHFDHKTGKPISPWRAARRDIRQRFPNTFTNASLRFEERMQIVFLAEKEGVTVEEILARKRAPKTRKSDPSDFGTNGQAIGVGQRIARVKAAQYTRRGI